MDPFLKHKAEKFIQMTQQILGTAEVIRRLDIDDIDRFIQQLEQVEDPNRPDPMPLMEHGWRNQLSLQLAKLVREFKCKLPGPEEIDRMVEEHDTPRIVQ